MSSSKIPTSDKIDVISDDNSSHYGNNSVDFVVWKITDNGNTKGAR
jgi:hypothetical protein